MVRASVASSSFPAKGSAEHGGRLQRWRWVVKRTFA